MIVVNSNFRNLNTKQKGEIAESNVVSLLLERGFSVSKPFGDNQPYDLILDMDEKLHKIQCKLGRLLDSGIEFQASKCRINSKKYVISNYSGLIDFFAIWLPEIRNELFLVPVDLAGKRETILSTSDSSTARLKAQDYIFTKFKT